MEQPFILETTITTLRRRRELEELARLEAEENQVSEEEVQVASAGAKVIIKLKKPIKRDA